MTTMLLTKAKGEFPMKSATTKTTLKHDRTAIREFLMHLAGELKRQQLALGGKSVSAKLEQGVQQLRSKYGTHLLPDAEDLGFLASEPGGDAQHDAVRQSLIARRGDQVKQIMCLLDLLGELPLNGGVQQPSK